MIRNIFNLTIKKIIRKSLSIAKKNFGRQKKSLKKNSGDKKTDKVYIHIGFFVSQKKSLKKTP